MIILKFFNTWLKAKAELQQAHDRIRELKEIHEGQLEVAGRKIISLQAELQQALKARGVYRGPMPKS